MPKAARFITVNRYSEEQGLRVESGKWRAAPPLILKILIQKGRRTGTDHWPPTPDFGASTGASPPTHTVGEHGGIAPTIAFHPENSDPILGRAQGHRPYTP